MRYVCDHCDHAFEHEGDDKPRCPSCMRVHGLRRTEQAPATPAGGNRTWAVLAIAALAIGGAGTWWAFGRGDEQPAQTAADDGVRTPVQLAARLKEQGIEDSDLHRLFEADDALAAFAREAGGGQPIERARKLSAALRARAGNGRILRKLPSEPPSQPPRIASVAFAALAEDAAGAPLSPLEVAAIAVAGLRSMDVPAKLAEIFAFPGETQPLDPSGRMGYFGVAVPAGDDVDVIAVATDRTQAPPPADRSVLDDEAALGLALTAAANANVSRYGDIAQAMRFMDAALAFAPRSPTVRVAHGFVLLATGGVEEGSREIESAMQLRDDAPRVHARAVVHLAAGEVDDAAQLVSRALQQQPDYAAAHLTLGGLHMARGEFDRALAELREVEEHDPDMPNLPLSWAQWHASQGQIDEAVAKARAAVERYPDKIEMHLMLASLYRGMGRFDDMRVLAREALALVPESERERARKLIERSLGPTALELPEDAGAPPAVPALDPTLGAEPGGPSLLDGELSAPSGAPGLQPGGGAPKLRLQRSGPRLDLGH